MCVCACVCVCVCVCVCACMRMCVVCTMGGGDGLPQTGCRWRGGYHTNKSEGRHAMARSRGAGPRLSGTLKAPSPCSRMAMWRVYSVSFW